ncbi:MULTISPECIES: polysaccharide deacetylase family protein [Flavobacteriaceae]|uniref:Polysaccharide deacetylase family protein n=2 Tax=Flavobacteriaceae TaxID=49546 RepID=A0A4Y8ASS9_9FLAO|nr:MULTISPECIES: polysaccharide deacetylase family protein [Flavobacteriaceae]TEW74934.1 polysaccharide deacetylase family protein [Gramella jeungdoensis]GGK42936.1 polysaccharide deacetylase [Lutibacter litoralis]
MKSYFIKTPNLLKIIFNKWVWSFSSKEKTIYLTFDDGPTPEITEWTLNQLKNHNAKATFFCIGKNVEKHPEIFQKIIESKQAIGNHTYNHLNGWKTNFQDYFINFKQANKTISNNFNLYSKSQKKLTKLFRPPYGRISLKQSEKIRKDGYKIIMWDVLSADFDTTISNKDCLKNVIQNIKNGSIVVFHDSKKASEKLKYVLPKILEYYSDKGYSFKTID